MLRSASASASTTPLPASATVSRSCSLSVPEEPAGEWGLVSPRHPTTALRMHVKPFVHEPCEASLPETGSQRFCTQCKCSWQTHRHSLSTRPADILLNQNLTACAQLIAADTSTDAAAKHSMLRCLNTSAPVLAAGTPTAATHSTLHCLTKSQSAAWAQLQAQSLTRAWCSVSCLTCGSWQLSNKTLGPHSLTAVANTDGSCADP